MSRYILNLFGTLKISIEGELVADSLMNKLGALLAYLALETSKREAYYHERRVLAGRFWPDMEDKYALQNLRSTLYSARRLLRPDGTTSDQLLLEVTPRKIRFNRQVARIDVIQFQELLTAVSRHDHTELATCASCVAQLEEAVELYQGELLMGLGLGDAPAFEEWLLLRRELLQQQVLSAMSRLAEVYEVYHDWDKTYQMVNNLLELDPYREESYRALMRISVAQREPEQALIYFEKLRRLLQNELAVEPSLETMNLIRQITADEFDQIAGRPQGRIAELPSDQRAIEVPVNLSSFHTTPSFSPFDLREVPDPGPFFGRMQEQRQIAQWLQKDRCRLIAILGIGGIGKTSLAAHSVRAISASSETEPFDIVLWRSLLNAPPLAELLPPLLQILSAQQLTKAPESLDEQIRLFLSYLHDRRVLLVLDNMESILEPARAGVYRPGYEPYGQLIQQMATLEHQSHLLLTSRERPRGYARLEGDSQLVQALQLDGLDSGAGHELLAQRGLHGVDAEEAKLVKCYSGNPLALKLVADTVDELFGGDIAEFLAEESPVFDDVRDVLDQQFARLTGLEQEILFWLAVERETRTTAELRKNLLQRPNQRIFMEALRGLQRRSLIERQDAGFSLQNVVTEYLTDRLVEGACREIETGDIQRLARQALLKAQAQEYVRESQARLILQPLGEQLIELLGRPGFHEAIQRLLAGLRANEPRVPSYAAGNLLNLLLHHDFDLTAADFSRLHIQEAHLQGASLTRVDFSHAQFMHTTFTSNFGRVKAIAISPDSKLLALGTDDGEVRLWRLADGQLVSMLRGHRSLVFSVAFSPDSRRLVSSSTLDGTIYLWDVGSGGVLTTFQGHQGGVDVVTFSPDGAVVASGGQDGTIRFWDTLSGKLLAVLEQHTDWMTLLAFHPTGELLASCDHSQNGCYLWQHQSAQGYEDSEASYSLLATLNRDAETIRSVAFSPDGSRLATGNQDGTVYLWNLARREIVSILRGHRNEVRSVVFTPDGAILASSGHDATIHLWDLATGQSLNVLRRHARSIWTMAISGDGKTLASGGNDGLVCLWDLHEPRKVQMMRTLHGHVQPIYALALNPRGDLFATGEDDGRVRLWQLAPSGKETQSLRILSGHSALVDSLAFSPDGRWLASSAHDNSARLWHVESGECIDILYTPPTNDIHIAFHPNGKLIACSISAEIHLWEISTLGHSRTVAMLYGHLQNIRRVSFSPDGRYLASYSMDNIVRLWDVATGECLHVFDEDVLSFWSLAFSPNGELLAGSGRSGIHVWDLRTDSRTRIVYSAMVDATNLRPVAFSPDGKLLVSGGVDRMVRIWDLEQDIELHCLAGHSADVTSTFFLPEGDTIISSSYDGTVRLWDVHSGICRQTLRIPGPYEGMNITGVTGITEAQRAALKALGAVEDAETAISARSTPVVEPNNHTSK